MPEHIYVTVGEAVEMHRQLIEEFGGIHGLRDRGLLEAAIFRPQSGYHDDLVHEAAALMESLANNHAFLDGNKRISFATTDSDGLRRALCRDGIRKASRADEK